MKMTENNYNTDIGKRVLEYTKRKQDKIKVINSTQEEKEFRHCTFKPHLTTNQPKIKSTHQLHTKKGIDKFVERQTKGREERKRIEKILNSNFRLKKYKATKTEDKSGYTHKYLKSVQPGFDEVFRGMKGRSLGDNSLILHNLLQEI